MFAKLTTTQLTYFLLFSTLLFTHKHTIVQEREVQITNGAKELSAARTEIRCVTQNNQNLEKRLFKLQEDVDGLKVKLTIANDAEKVCSAFVFQIALVHSFDG